MVVGSDFVMDASFTIPWVFRDEQNTVSDEAWKKLIAGKATAHVPGLWLMEMVNVTLRGPRKSKERLAEEDIAEFFKILRKISIRVHHHGVETVLDRTPAIMRRHGLTAYDSAYLMLAMASGFPLATADERLRAAAVAEEVELIA